MVSKFSYWSGKELNVRGRIPWVYAVIIPLIYVIISLSPESLFALFGAYALSAPAVLVWRKAAPQRKTGRRRRLADRSRRANSLSAQFGRPYPLAPAIMDSRRLAYLNALDIDVWERRDLPRQPARAQVRAEIATSRSRQRLAVSARDSPDQASTRDAARWAGTISQPPCAAARCARCMPAARRQYSASATARREWMVIGEAPGMEEDRQGEPFVGRAGQLLNSMLKAMGLAREQVFIANILKSRPPNNRDPRPEEVRACMPYLYRQIELVNPTLILCVGRIAAQTLLETD